MSLEIFFKNGIFLDIDDKRIGLDPGKDRDSDLIFISHAHADHTLSEDTVTPKICSKATKELLVYRKNFEMINTITSDDIIIDGMKLKQFDSGHIIGSTSFLIEANKKKIFYTGDICNRFRFHMQGAKVPKSDIMIIESTYGHPKYVFPPVYETVSKTKDWIEENLRNDVSSILLGYTLGKAQILTKIIEGFDCLKILEDSVKDMNSVCKKFGFNSKEMPAWSEIKKIGKEPFVGVFPSHNSHSRIIREIKDRFDAKIAYFTGWGIANEKIGDDVDAVFPLSDHCDFNGLLQVVKESKPEKIFTVHGFSEELADAIRNKLHMEAETL